MEASDKNVHTRRATLHDADNIIKLLDGFYPGVPQHWRKLFQPRPWSIQNDFPGFVIEDKNKIVGFLGTIFSEQAIDAHIATICNLTTWYVEANYRQFGLNLFAKLMQLPQVTWTNLTPAPHLYKWLLKSGFKPFEDKQRCILPIPNLHRKSQVNCQIITEEQQLPSEMLDLFRKHSTVKVKHILIQQDFDYCYCLAIISRYKKMPLAKIYYLSHPEVFARNIAKMRFALCQQLKVMYLLTEERYLNNKKIFASCHIKLQRPRLYKSKTLTHQQIPLTFSELFVLGI